MELRTVEHTPTVNAPQTARDLIDNPLHPGDLGYDKVYLTGRLQREGTVWEYDIAGAPICVLNADRRSDLGLSDSVPLVRDVAKKESGCEELSMIAGGCFVTAVINGERVLVTHRRSLSAPSMAGYLTGPAGRSGEKPSETVKEELQQELLVFVRENNTDKLLAMVYPDSDIESLILERIQTLRQAEKFISNQIANRTVFTTEGLLELRRDEDDLKKVQKILASGRAGIKIMDISMCLGSGVQEVIVRSGDEIIDSVKNAISYYDPPTNTLEVRQVVHLPDSLTITSIRGGDYDDREGYYFRPAKLFREDEIVPELFTFSGETDENPTVAALTGYLKQHIFERQAHSDW